ncbi:MAG: FkbM family methyltransferase [Flavobacteriaceae bacterium]
MKIITRKIYYKLINRSEFLNNIFQNLKFQLRFNNRTRKTIWGFKFIGTRSMAKGTFEKEETNFFNNTITNYDIFINIGANVGYYVLNALNSNKKIKVYAFEPIIQNFILLKKNVSLNSFNDRVVAENIALGNKNTDTKIYGNTTGASLLKGWSNNPENFFQTVKCFKLDTYARTKGINFEGENTFIMIDVEGFELEVLEGAKTILKNTTPTLFVEICNGQHFIKNDNLFVKKFQFLYDIGYSSYVLNGGVIEKYKIDLTKNETHNFIFVHETNVKGFEKK